LTRKNRLEHLYDKSSVEIHSLAEDTETAVRMSSFILYMLEQHAEYANSSKARNLITNWLSN